MAFRTRRQKRYENLRNNGFLPFEARVLSKVPRKVPYMPPLIANRAKLQVKAKKEEWSQKRYEDYIKKLYKDRGWLGLTRTGKVKYDTWQMLRESEDRYRNKHPEYSSPWLKKQKVWRDFVAKFERTVEKYPRGKAYPSKAETIRKAR